MTSVQERAALGKAARRQVPRSSHADYKPANDRADPIAILEAQATTRVADLVPIRYGRMLVSPFAFYRGGAAIMAADLAHTPVSGIRVQACGDAHLSNFGVFAAPDRRLVFSLNDFDETLPAPWEWDVKRLVTSFAIVARDLGFDDAARRATLLTVAASYRGAMRQFAEQRNLDLWYARLEVDEIVRRLQEEAASRAKRAKVSEFDREMQKARTKDSLHAYNKMVTSVDGMPRFVSDPPLIQPIEELAPPDRLGELHEFLQSALRDYGRTLPADRRHLLTQFTYVAVARKVVGVGSVGTRAWVMLLLGRDSQDPLIMQMKEANPSVLEPYAGKSRYSNQGQRVVAGQQLMQSSSDIFLGWYRVATGVDGRPHDYYIRQLRDGKASIDVDKLDPDSLKVYGRMCGWTLARAHARSGDRIAIASYLGTSSTFDEAVAAFGDAYAEQNDQDHAALAEAVRDGRVEAQKGV